MIKLTPLPSRAFCLAATESRLTASCNVTPSSLNSGSSMLLAFVTIARSGGCATGEDDVASACAGGGEAELLGDFLSQPAIKIVAAIIPVMIAFFIKRQVA